MKANAGHVLEEYQNENTLRATALVTVLEMYY